MKHSYFTIVMIGIALAFGGASGQSLPEDETYHADYIFGAPAEPTQA